MTRSIELRTSLPGPKSQAILARKELAVAGPLVPEYPVFVAEASGSTVTDVDGNTFLDFCGGIGALNVGHCHPRVVAAAQEQLEKFFHTVITTVPYELYVSLAERLLALTPISGPTKAAFFNTGAEAVENAVKFARTYTKRTGVIAMEGAFHGRTLLAMTLTSKQHPYKAGLGPFAPEVYRVPFAQAYRGPDAPTALATLERTLITQVAPESVAAIVIEPQLGEGGFIPALPEFMTGLRRICDENGIVMIVDEVQSGFGRSGKMFAIEHYGVEPDLMAIAKSIGAGLPLSGVLGKAAIMDSPPNWAVGGTYIGNPVALAAAHAVLDVIEDERLVERAAAMGETIRARMLGWQERFEQIGDVRGLGAMLGMELVHDRESKDPAPDLLSALSEEAFRNGLLLASAGIYSNVIRGLAPLVISDAQLDEALDVWELSLERVLGDGGNGRPHVVSDAAAD